ncbi:hypothetical protein FIBSPDRAFT_764346 [Athelia psychrophila]|uniref:F-box domain-containing protein n=1 Tax=Athelia psychrophila TaxID=1759441 RepID=A0A167WU67_9AGAM|nr:hypothetical protein FIBSPDRAFT_764346 [Fibularhizoctonia sp. CBS 109695]
MDSDVPTSYLNFNFPDSALCVLPASWNSSNEELDVPVQGEEDTFYAIGYAGYIQAQLSAVSVMTLATGGRMTLPRLWRLAMKLGWNKNLGSSLRLPGIDYEENLLVHKSLHMAKKAGTKPKSIPQSDIILAQELGDVARVKQFFMKRAGLSFWMRPDRFPLADEDGTENYCPAFVGAPSSLLIQYRLVEALPHELFVQILCQLPLSSIFSLCSSSRALRHKLLAFESDRNSLARQWIATTAPWYLPQIPNSGLSSVPGVTWAYLMQCLRSGSMRNRQRIWEMSLKLERRAGEMEA